MVLLAFEAATDRHGRGVELFRQHRYLEAITEFQTALQTEGKGSTDYNESVLMIGQSFFTLSRFADAISWLEKAPQTNESIYMLGYAYEQAGRSQESVQAFARLFGLDPKSAGAYLLTGQMLLKRQLDKAAFEQFKKALILDPKLPEAHYLLGEIALFRGLLPESVAEFKQELSINPNFSNAWYCLGDAYTRQSNWDVAIDNLQRAIWLNKDFSAPYILLGKCCWANAITKGASGRRRNGFSGKRCA